MSRGLVFLYRFLTVGGVENVLAERMAELERRGIDSTAIFLEDAGGRSMFPPGTGRIEICPDRGRFERSIRRLEPRAILSIDTPEALAGAREAAPGARLVYEVHTPYPPGLAVLREKGSLEGVERLAVPSPSQAALVSALLRHPLPVHVVPNSLAEKFRTPADALEVPPRPVVAWVGRLDYLKNWRAFVDIAEEVSGSLDADFWMAGGRNSPEREKRELGARSAALAAAGRFRWIPEVLPAEMPSFYAAVAASGGCVVSTSWAESFGLVVLEAMAGGCPVVGADVVGLRDLVRPGHTGWTYPPDQESIAVRAVIAAVTDADGSRTDIVRKARAQALLFTPARAVDSLLGVADGSGAPAIPPARGNSASLTAAIVDITRDLSDAIADRDGTVRALQSEMRSKIAEGDRLLRNLQEEMHAKVAERDRLLRELQDEMHAKVAERDRSLDELRRSADRLARAYQGAREELALERATVGILRRDLERVYSSRPWRLATRYWNARSRLARLLGGKTPEAAAGPPAEPPPRLASPPTAEASAHAREALPPSGDSTLAPAPLPAGASAVLLKAEPSPIAQAPLAEESRHDVLCLPIIDWDFRFQRPQQLMTQFAKAGHRVFYVAQGFRTGGPAYEIRRKAENVYEVSLRGAERNVYRDLLDESACSRLFASLDALRRDLSLGATAVVVQLPFWWPLARRAREAFAWPVVYDCMDDHAGFSTNRKKMLDEEEELCASADLVAASSLALAEKASRLNGNVVLVRNACDYLHFASAGEPSEGRPRPVIGYYGAIADWFDSDLVAQVARKRPDWDFVLVGSTFSADVSKLERLKNVSLPGEKPYAEIPTWLAGFDAAIIPFKRVPLTEATNPVKAYEILASGKPLVAVPLPEIQAMAPHVRFASTPDDFIREIDAALADPATGQDARRAFARENTWEKRFEVFSSAVASAFPPASVIVVTYGNLGFNQLCLESLRARTEWPNRQIIVVDNASTDGTPEYLRELESRWPELTVILNETNRGFAAANNQGLRQARGDVLVLLNNDTVVSRGWLSTLIRHLRAKPGIGLIGPVTNQIGNEAKIPVGYSAVEEMPDWALNHARENDGRSFSIPMLAMFCVAMRRPVFTEVGPLDERFGIGMFEDDDYTHRVRAAGYDIVCCRDAFVHHWMKASFGKMPEEAYRALFETNRRLFEEKWGLVWTPHASAPDTLPSGSRP